MGSRNTNKQTNEPHALVHDFQVLLISVAKQFLFLTFMIRPLKMKMQRYGKINSRQINICSQNIISLGTQIVVVSILRAAMSQPFTLPQSSYRSNENILELLNVRIRRQINFISQFILKIKNLLILFSNFRKL